jgi:hypothetical protein
MTVLPFTNTIDLISLRGQTIIDAFEFSASKLNEDGSGSSGGFLQVSGISFENFIKLWIKVNIDFAN